MAQSDRICVCFHIVVWLATDVVWAVSWWRFGSAPSGPLYNFALKFIARLDILVSGNIEEFTIRLGQIVSAHPPVDLGASFNVIFALLILVAGTLQWFLLGRLVQWISSHHGNTLASGVLGFYGLWAASAFFLWVAA